MGVVEVVRVFPGVILYSVAFPFDQVLELSLEHPAVQDFFYKVFILTIDEFWGWQRWLPPSDDRVVWGRGQFYNVKDRVEAIH